MKEDRQKRSHNISFHLFEILRIDQSREVENILAVAKGLGGRGNRERLLNGRGVFDDDKNVLNSVAGNHCTILWMC